MSASQYGSSSRPHRVGRLTWPRGGGHDVVGGMRTVPNKKPRNPIKPLNAVPGQAPETQLESAGQVAVTYGVTPPKGPPDKQIHPRRRLADVPDAPPRGRDQK
jgi:hypothetical protein